VGAIMAIAPATIALNARSFEIEKAIGER